MALQNHEIAIIHGTASHFDEVLDTVFQNHTDYALKHGYMLHEHKLDPEKGERLWAIYQTFQENPSIRRAFWINADAVFTNLELTLTEHLPDGKVVMPYDIFGPNADCLWLENCPEVRRLLWAAGRIGAWVFEGNNPRTINFKELMGLRYLSLHPPYQELFTYVKPNLMRSHYIHYDKRPKDEFGKWTPGDFILSLDGIAHPFKPSILKKVFPLSCSETPII